MQQVSALTSGWSEREIRDAPPTKTGWSDRRRTGGGSTGRGRERERERMQRGRTEDHTHMRESACTWLGAAASAVSFRPAIVLLFVPLRRRPCQALRSLTRTELCHRAALCYEAVIQRARENMRRAATYASTTRCAARLLRGLIDPESRTENRSRRNFYAQSRDTGRKWLSLERDIAWLIL